MTVDPSHWLLRHTADEWLRAATHELAEAVQAFAAREHRHGVAASRRAAGMALNALLVQEPNDAWGRSYMDHVRALAVDPQVPELLRESARVLVQEGLDAPRLVGLGPPRESGLPAATATILEWVRDRLVPA